MITNAFGRTCNQKSIGATLAPAIILHFGAITNSASGLVSPAHRWPRLSTYCPVPRFHYTMLAWLPTFYIRTLDLDLIRASQLSLIPPIAAFAFSNIAGPIADNLINGGTRVVTVRKGMQGIAFVGPSLMLLGAAVLEDQHVARVRLPPPPPPRCIARAASTMPVVHQRCI